MKMHYFGLNEFWQQKKGVNFSTFLELVRGNFFSVRLFVYSSNNKFLQKTIKVKNIQIHFRRQMRDGSILHLIFHLIFLWDTIFYGIHLIL